MSDKAEIKILSFKQFNISEKQELTYIARGESIMNILIYSPNKQMKFLDKPLQELNKSDQIFIAKCFNATSLSYALRNCKVGINSILISDKQLDQQIVDIIYQNQKDLKNEQKIKVWMYVPIVENVNHKYFHQQIIQLISCDQSKIIKLIQQDVSKVRNLADQCRSTTTIQSGDEQLMKNKISINQNNERKVIETPRQPQEQLFNDGVPGVGSYNIGKDIYQTGNGGWPHSKRQLVFPVQSRANKNEKSVKGKQKGVQTAKLFQLTNNSNVPGVGTYQLKQPKNSRKIIFGTQQRQIVFPPEDIKNNVI